MSELKCSNMEMMEMFISTFPSSSRDLDTKTKLFPNTGIGLRILKSLAGDVILGKIHKVWQVNILASGTMMVTNDPTEKAVKISAPYSFETGPDSQKFGMCLTDCVFINAIVSNNETIEELELRSVKDSRVAKLIKENK